MRKDGIQVTSNIGEWKFLKGFDMQESTTTVERQSDKEF